MQGINFLGWRRQSMLGHGRQNLGDFLSEISLAKVIQIVWVLRPKRLSHNHHACIMRILHLSVFLSRQKLEIMRLSHNLFTIRSVCSMNNLQIAF